MRLGARALVAALLALAAAACSGKPASVQGPAAASATHDGSGGPSADGIAEATSATSGAQQASATARSKSVDDPALLTCKTVSEPPPSGVCGVLEKAPRAPEGAGVTKVVAVWKRLEAPFAAMSGRETALVVLGPDATTPDGAPIPPAAYICPGAPPTVYVPNTLVQLIDNKDATKYPDDFLAFVIGHELGHRMNDLTADGCQLAAFQRPGKGLHEEELADARSAFFITSAGFSASKIARDDMVSRFLEAEYSLRRDDTRSRKDSLLDALRRFDGYEALYQTALAVALTGEMEAADRLLTWADELVQSHGVPLPELRVVRAIARINRAAEMAPWLAELGMPVGIDDLRCTPLHPGHSGLWEEPDKQVRGPDVERGRKLLKEALVLLGEAEARGATPFTVAAARACANLYLADATAAAEAQARAESLLPTGAKASVKTALATNRALVTFLAFARKNQAPSIDESTALDTWTDGLTAALGTQPPPALAALLARLRNPMGRAPQQASSGPVCSGAKYTKTTFAALPSASQHATCPAGYKLAHALPSADAAKSTGSTQGITMCTPDKGDGELVTVRLAATTEPPLAALERTLLAMRPPVALQKLDAWACQCSALERQGISDRGEIVYSAWCPALQLEQAVLVTIDGRVDAVIQHSR